MSSRWSADIFDPGESSYITGEVVGVTGGKPLP
jgi:hypothetical protein